MFRRRALFGSGVGAVALIKSGFAQVFGAVG
jgi:hypothetical protein